MPYMNTTEPGKLYVTLDESHKEEFIFKASVWNRFVPFVNLKAKYKGHGSFTSIQKVRPATKKEIEHFKQCEMAGKYVEYVHSEINDNYKIF